MPVKRRLAKGRRGRITEDAIQAWLAGAKHGLHRALDLRPWEWSPFDVEDGTHPLIAVPDDWDRGYEAAVETRRELLRHGPPGRVGRHGEPWSAEDDAAVAAGEWAGR